MAEKKKWVRNWFSNMIGFDEPLIYQGIEYHAPENFYQAMKLPRDRLDLRAEIAAMSARKSKTAIRDKDRYPWREDWTKEESLKVMEFALRHKFTADTTWGIILLERDADKEIIEWNNWNDIFWGRCIYTNKGENHLGKILMKIRAELKEEQEAQVNTEAINDRSFIGARTIFESLERRLINGEVSESYKTPEERPEQFKKGNGLE